MPVYVECGLELLQTKSCRHTESLVRRCSINYAMDTPYTKPDGILPSTKQKA